MIPAWHHWRDRPLTVGTLAGAGGGRSLIVNGHIDVIDAGEPARWTSPPFDAEVVDGRIVGRGAADMKGGIAAAMVSHETLVGCGVRLGGDVIFQVVPDEETGGMGTIAAAERGYRAEAALVVEPSGLDIWTVTRGILHARPAIIGRSAHAEVTQPDWRAGGGVNANHKALPIAAALVALGDRWADCTHPMVGPPSLHLTALRGGSFIRTSRSAASSRSTPPTCLPRRTTAASEPRSSASSSVRSSRPAAATNGSSSTPRNGPGSSTTRRERSSLPRASSRRSRRRRESGTRRSCGASTQGSTGPCSRGSTASRARRSVQAISRKPTRPTSRSRSTT